MPVIINDQNWQQFVSPVIGGDKKSHGLKPRDYSVNPVGCHAFAPAFPDDELIPEVEWPERFAEMQAKKSSLLDLRADNYSILKSLDQDGFGLCWAFSTTKAMMYLRALMNESPVVLSAWYVAGKVKGWQDQGGWGAESLAQIVQGGVPAMSFCPSYKSSYDTAATRENAALHKCTEWWDGSDNRDLARRQMVSTYLKGRPSVNDYNFWSHSVCGIAIVNLNPLRVAIDNSWGENAGDKGIYILEGSKAIPDGLVIPRVTYASAA